MLQCIISKLSKIEIPLKVSKNQIHWFNIPNQIESIDRINSSLNFTPFD